MERVIWIKLANEIIPFLLLIGLGFVLYRGFRKNQALLLEREDLLKRYLLFRGDKQARLKIYGEDEKVYQDILRTLSASWKHFKKTYDQCLLSFARNTNRTKLLLQAFTLALLINSARLLVEEYYFYGFESRFLYAFTKELSSYVLVFLSFALLKAQTDKFLSLKGNSAKMDREALFFPNSPSAEREKEGLYNEFDPIEITGVENGGVENGKNDKDPYGRANDRG
jgi:hypothetical protein